MLINFQVIEEMNLILLDINLSFEAFSTIIINLAKKL